MRVGSRPVKVLHILNELQHSGAEVMLHSAQQTFRRREIESHILSTGARLGKYASILGSSGYKIHHIPFRKTPRFLIQLWALMARECFDVLHIHTERAFIWYVFVGRLSRVPVVIRTFHSIFLFSSYLRWKRTLQRRISRELFRTIHVAIGDSVRTIEKTRFANDCILVRNWTDVDRFRPPNEDERIDARRRCQLEDGDFALVTVGTCNPAKNHMASLVAVKKINERLNGKRVVLLHVGDGESIEEEKRYATQNGIQQHCLFIGRVDDVRPCLYAADAFAMTSDWEGLPIAAVEAMSTGLPAILYDVYGLRDLLQDGKGGILIEPAEEHLIDALALMIERPDLRKAYADQAREKIRSSYALEECVENLCRLYVLGRKALKSKAIGDSAYLADQRSDRPVT
jgi:glycosyltransferase involved in cell wall biosynthesis